MRPISSSDVEVVTMRRPVGDRGEMDDAVGRAADRLHDNGGIAESRRRQQFRGTWSPPLTAISAARLPLASARRKRSACGAGMVALIGSDRPSTSVTQAIVLAVPITMQVPTEGARRSLTISISSASISPARCALQEAATIGTGAEHLTLVMTDDHGSDGDHHRRQIDGCRGHDLGRQRLVTAADDHDGVHRLRADHLLGVHGHQVAQEHRGGVRKLSWIEMVGNTIGIAPASITPRFTASMMAGTLPWHGL